MDDRTVLPLISTRTRRMMLAAVVGLGAILSAGCEHNKSESPSPGAQSPGAGAGQRGGANDGTAAGNTGSSNEAGGKFNNGTPAGMENKAAQGKSAK